MLRLSYFLNRKLAKLIVGTIIIGYQSQSMAEEDSYKVLDEEEISKIIASVEAEPLKPGCDSLGRAYMVITERSEKGLSINQRYCDIDIKCGWLHGQSPKEYCRR